MRWRLAAILLVVGCAGYRIDHNGDGRGYDVYKPEPYLLVVHGPKGPGASILYLPDYGNRYRIDTWNVLAKADFSFHIENGWMLSRISDKSDTTEIPDAFVKALEEARKSEVIPLSGEPFEIYKILYDPSGQVTGLARLKTDLLPEAHDPPEVPD
jgi:hypothetical protein